MCNCFPYVVPAGSFARVTNAATGGEVVDPGSFQYMARTPVSVFAVLMSVTQGMQNAAYIISSCLIIGGTFAIMDATSCN